MPTAALQNEEELKTRLSFDFRDGGRFLSDPSIDDKTVVGAIQLLGAVVDFSTENELVTGKHEYKVHSVVPNIVRKFAEQSRTHEGIRLLKRAVRHAAVTVTVSLEFEESDGTTVTKHETFERVYPSAVGTKSPRNTPTTDSRGVASDRRAAHELRQIKKVLVESTQHDISGNNGALNSVEQSSTDVAASVPAIVTAEHVENVVFGYIRHVEMNNSNADDKPKVFNINTTVRKEAGLDAHEATSTPIPTEIPSRKIARKRKRNKSQCRNAAKRRPVRLDYGI